MRQLEGQMALALFAERMPFNCPDEAKVADIGGGKSFCTPWNCWTNCREVGHCVYERWVA
ncbi:MAG: hypothetical protein IJ111_01455 [Eggerthellaceae bacterium]|nr:hypothetical protein [Eggerthellaceae bacterium]